MEAIALLDIRDEPLSLDEVWQAVAHPAAGGAVIFVGTVRDVDEGKGVEQLGYSAHPTATAELRAIAEKVAADFPVVRLAAVHRTGDLVVGDIAVIVGASCPHRGEAFEAARRLIDDLKSGVPIWKHQLFADGTQEWVGTP